MRKFWIRMANLVAVVVILLAYHMVLEVRISEDQVARLQAELKSAKLELGNGGRLPAAGYRDGNYSGEAAGFGGLISTEVTIENGRITDIQILSADGEDGSYLSMAKEMIPAIMESQTSEVDTVSGATFSSSGIKNAVAQALGKAGK